MNSTRTLVIAITWTLLSAPLVGAQDLSRYREFQIGMNLSAVAKLANEKPSEAKVVHQRPAVIQELEWQPQRFLGSSPQTDPVKEVLFSFYNGELFRMSVTYDWYRTGGLTTEDVVEAHERRSMGLQPGQQPRSSAHHPSSIATTKRSSPAGKTRSTP